jgi:hypothetical protein
MLLITVSFPVWNYCPEEFFGSTLSILIPLFFFQASFIDKKGFF